MWKTIRSLFSKTWCSRLAAAPNEALQTAMTTSTSVLAKNYKIKTMLVLNQTVSSRTQQHLPKHFKDKLKECWTRSLRQSLNFARRSFNLDEQRQSS